MTTATTVYTKITSLIVQLLLVLLAAYEIQLTADMGTITAAAVSLWYSIFVSALIQSKNVT